MSAKKYNWLFYGELLEDHVCASLADSLRKEGHTVYRLDSVYKSKYLYYDKGFKTINRENLDNVHKHIENFVNSHDIDIFFTYRFFEIPTSILENLKKRGIKTLAWYADDPLLFNLSKVGADDYDITLHTGDKNVLDFYATHCSKNVKRYLFPFWTSQKYYPNIYDPHKAEFDIGFLGNIDDNKRKGARYDFLARCPFKRIMWGKAANDYASICAGYIDNFLDIPKYLKKIRLAINFPQDFTQLTPADGLLYFDGVNEFVEFYITSRIVQYSACGIPIVNISKIDPKLPYVFHAYTHDEAIELCRNILQSTENLQAISKNTVEMFEEFFSADKRAAMLIKILDIEFNHHTEICSTIWKTV